MLELKLSSSRSYQAPAQLRAVLPPSCLLVLVVEVVGKFLRENQVCQQKSPREYSYTQLVHLERR